MSQEDLTPVEVAALTKRWFHVTLWIAAIPAVLAGLAVEYPHWDLIFIPAFVFGPIWGFTAILEYNIRFRRWRDVILLKSLLAGLSVGILAPPTILLSLFAVVTIFYSGDVRAIEVVHTFGFLLLLSWIAMFITIPICGILGLAIGWAIRRFLHHEQRTTAQSLNR